MTMTPGDIRQTGDVVFTCTKDGEADAHSAADTGRERIVKVRVQEKDAAYIWFPAEKGSLRTYSARSWETAAKMLTEYVFRQADKHRDNIAGLRREYDALPTYQHSMKKVGNVVLRLTADGHVQARSLSDTTGADTDITVVYMEGHIKIGEGGSYARDWAEAIEKLAVRFDEYEKTQTAAEDLKTAFGNLPHPD